MPVMMRRRTMVPLMPAPMMMILRRRSDSRYEQHWNHGQQSNFEDVFHVKSPEPLTSGVPLNHNWPPEAARYCD